MRRRVLIMTGLTVCSLVGAFAVAALLRAGGGSAGIAVLVTHSVTITSGPAGTVASTDASFSYTSSARASFACSLDGGSATGCGSGLSGTVTYTGLSAGGHTFVVEAAVSSRDVASARRSWTVAPPPPPPDRTPPETAITSAVAGPVLSDDVQLPLSLGTVPLNIATFAFSANEDSTFTCTLDGRRFACPSPVRNPHLGPGRHRFEVAATDRAGNTDPTPAVQEWAVGPVVGDVTAQPRPLKLAGAKILRARDLLPQRLHPVPRRARAGQEVDEYEGQRPVDEPGDDDCRVVGCGRGDSRSHRLLAQGPDLVTPPLTRGPYLVGTRGNDPNIAASDTHLVVTNGTVIRFFDKAGTQLSTISAWQFFWPTWFDPANQPTINQGLNLPPGLNCNPAIDVFTTKVVLPPGSIANCMDEVYDTRVIFDDFRKRFWLVSLVRNDSITNFWKLPPQQRAGRRDRLLLAVSSSQDPTDFWYVYGFSGAIDQGACNNIGASPGPPPVCPGTGYRPLTATDYPAIGISQDYFVTAIDAINFNPWANDVGAAKKTPYGYTSISVFDANKLANGGCTQTCSWQYGPFTAGITTSSGKVVFKGDPFFSLTEPAVQHDAGPDGAVLLASTLADYDLVALMSFNKKQAYIAPPLHVSFAPIAPLSAGVNNMPQKPSAPVTSPIPIQVKNLNSIMLKAVARADRLYLTFQDCKTPVGGACSSAVRALVLDLDTVGNTVFGTVLADRTLNLSDPSYGNPAIEVNKLGDAVVVYNRSGTSTFLQARYTALFHGQLEISPGSILKAGNFPFGGNATMSSPASVLNLDTGGIAVDPFDHEGIWMAHAYSYKQGSTGQVDTAIGKVFGKNYPDIAIDPDVLFPAAASAGERARIVLQLGNRGDGRSRRRTGSVYLRGKRGARIAIGRFDVPALPPGARRRIRVTIELPTTTKTGNHELQVVLPESATEYSTKNNAAAFTLRVRS